MLWASVDYAGWLTLIGVLPLIAGVFIWFIVRPGQLSTNKPNAE
jgi:uncharacterized membrane protein